MFTGLIEEVGVLEGLRRAGASARVSVRAPGIAHDVSPGDSIAVSGVCLTAIASDGVCLDFDAVTETLSRSGLGDLRRGEPVNLERALAAGGRLGGHFVQGHVDDTGHVAAMRSEGRAHVFGIAASPGVLRYVVEKGSIAVDGISLTVAGLDDRGFRVWVIPHTFANTNLHARHVGDRVNLEVDLLAKYVERLLVGRGAGDVTRAGLARAGFLDELGAGPQ
ncbi:MAG: riboflavin synthase [Chthonomonadales bacterium]|nr:riboflavin synthase [Chthonomonadales bacterium]